MSALTRYAGCDVARTLRVSRSRRKFPSQDAAANRRCGDAILRRAVHRLERHLDASAAGGSFRYRDRSIMPPDNLLDEIETQSCAAAVALRRDKTVQIRARDRKPVCRDRHRSPLSWPAAPPAPRCPLCGRHAGSHSESNWSAPAPGLPHRLAPGCARSAVERYFVAGGNRQRRKFGGYFPPMATISTEENRSACWLTRCRSRS